MAGERVEDGLAAPQPWWRHIKGAAKAGAGKVGGWLLGKSSHSTQVIGLIITLVSVTGWFLGVIKVIGAGYTIIFGVILLGAFVMTICVAISNGEHLDQAQEVIAELKLQGPGNPVSLEAAESLHDVQHSLRYCAYAMHSPEWTAAARTELEISLNATAKLFSQIVGVDCRACVKELFYDGDEEVLPDWSDPAVMSDLYVHTLWRNGNPPRDPAKDADIPILESTAFSQLWKRDGGIRWFMVNDIEAAYLRGEYKNPTRPQGQANPDYNASMVWPIQMDPSRYYGDRRDRHIVVFGYLCVDTKATNVFNSTHGWIGAGLADSYFTALHKPQEQPGDHAAKVNPRQ